MQWHLLANYKHVYALNPFCFHKRSNCPKMVCTCNFLPQNGVHAQFFCPISLSQAIAPILVGRSELPVHQQLHRYNIHGSWRQSLHLKCQILIVFNIFVLFIFYPGASCLYCNVYDQSVIYVDSYLSPQYPVCGLV